MWTRKYENVMIWHMYAIWTIWYDWHAKRRTSMKYNTGICMQDMINDMINYMRNDMGNDMKMIWYEQNTSGVVWNDNENGKMLEAHALLCVHTVGDTPIPSR